jgi:hypothetical protein
LGLQNITITSSGAAGLPTDGLFSCKPLPLGEHGGIKTIRHLAETLPVVILIQINDVRAYWAADACRNLSACSPKRFDALLSDILQMVVIQVNFPAVWLKRIWAEILFQLVWVSEALAHSVW